MKEIKIYLRLDGEMAQRFLQIKEHLGLKNDTEVARSLITWYWQKYREELQPKLEHFNINEHGILILDRTLQPDRIIQVYFKPEKVWCEFCASSKCKHVEFALSVPEVQKTLHEKGWKIK